MWFYYIFKKPHLDMVIIVWNGMNKAGGFEALLHSFCVGDVHAERVFVYGWQALLVTNNVQK